MEAQHKTKCAVCGEWINIGDEIVLGDDNEWVHENCDEEPGHGYWAQGDH